MSVLALHAGTTHVTAAVVDQRGRVVATAGREVPRHVPRPGWVEHAPEEVWQATLGATREVLGAVDASGLTALGVTNQRGTVRAVGPRDPRVAAPGDRRAGPAYGRGRILRRRAAVAGRARAAHLGAGGVGPVRRRHPRLLPGRPDDPRHLARHGHLQRRGDELLDLASGDWSDEQCGLFGVPRDALPDLVPSWGEVARTEPRAFLGLSLPVAAIVGDRQARARRTRLLRGRRRRLHPRRGGVAGGQHRYDAAAARSAACGPPSRGAPRAGGPTYALEGALRPSRGTVLGDRRLRVGGPAAADDARCQALADRVGLAGRAPRGGGADRARGRASSPASAPACGRPPTSCATRGRRTAGSSRSAAEPLQLRLGGGDGLLGLPHGVVRLRPHVLGVGELVVVLLLRRLELGDLAAQLVELGLQLQRPGLELLDLRGRRLRGLPGLGELGVGGLDLLLRPPGPPWRRPPGRARRAARDARPARARRSPR